MATHENPLIPNTLPTITATYHLRVIFFQYETTFLLTHLDNYLKQIQRNCPQFQPELPTMQIHHSLIQFQSTPLTRIPAYQLFPINVQLIHSFNPSQVYFLAKLDNQENLFPQSFELLNPKQSSGSKTLLSLDTNSGTLLIPSHYPPHQQEDIEIFSLSISACLESFQFSEAPFTAWKPVEASFGRLHFPSNMSILAALPPVQYANPLSHPPPTHPSQKNLRWTERPVTTSNPNYISSRQNAQHSPLHHPQMENQYPPSCPQYPSGIRNIPQSHKQLSDNLSSHTTSTNYYQGPTSYIQEVTPTILQVPQPLATLRPKLSFPIPSDLPEIQPAPTSQSQPQRLPGTTPCPPPHDHPPSYAEANPAHKDYRNDTLNHITSHLNRMSDSSADNLNRFNALRGTSPLLPSPIVPTTVTAPNPFQTHTISEPQAPPRHQQSQRITPLFTSTPLHEPQGVLLTPQVQALSPQQMSPLSQAQALPPHPLISHSVPLYQPQEIPLDLADQFHHQTTLHDDTTITPNSPTDIPQPPKVTVKYSDNGAIAKMDDIRKQKHSDNQQLGSRPTLDAMCFLLDKYPKHNQFQSCKHFSSDIPPKEIYTLSNNHRLYLNQILHQMNDHRPPTNIATFLTPYVSFDINHQKYTAVDHLLTLDIIQKLDHMLTSSIVGPSTFKRLKDRFTNRTRSSSK